MSYVVGLDEPECGAAATVGERGAALAHLGRAGLPTAPGFVVTTDAFGAPDQIDNGRSLPDAAIVAIGEAAARLSARGSLVVRPSATGAWPTAEAGGVTAGRGDDELLDAIVACWAAAREAVSGGSQVAVIVQAPGEAERRGTLTTVNPVTAATREVVIELDAGGGEHVVAKRTLAVRSRPAHGGLSDEDAEALTELGCRVEASLDGLPQVIEWAASDDGFTLLGVAPLTGVEITWDEDVDDYQEHPDDRDETVWSNQWSREFWAGALSPLHYSVRGRAYSRNHRDWRALQGFGDIKSLRLQKYRRATAFINTEVEALHAEYLFAGPVRPGVMGTVHPDDRPRLSAAPLDVARFAKAMLRIHVADSSSGVLSSLRASDRWMQTPIEVLDGPGEVQLRRFSDEALKAHIESQMDIIERFNLVLWYPFYIYAPWTLQLLRLMIEHWYPGEQDPARLLQDLISGLPQTTKTAVERRSLWDLAATIKQSPALTELFERFQDADFFEAAAELPEGRQFLDAYRTFLADFGHRGQADRDLFHPRRCEDPSLDYTAFKLMLDADPQMAPVEVDRRQVLRREAATEEVISAIGKSSLGALKVSVFKLVLGYAHRFLVLRDDQRWVFDRVVMSKKRAFQEVGRRLVERGLLEEADDMYFLSQLELYDLLTRPAQPPLVTAKITGRKRVFHRVLSREEVPPLYLDGREPLPEAAGGSLQDGSIEGVGLSGGEVTGTTRIVKTLHDLGRLGRDEILVCNGTDPGWAPAFVAARGLVLENGGVLSFGACLSREHGMPAVTLPGAMSHIPDGTLVTVNGDTGTITLAADGGSGDR